MTTEYEFTLPRGYLDESGNLHRSGTMRLATAKDEIKAMQDELVRINPDYMMIVLLSRVVTNIGSIHTITPTIIEHLFTVDVAYLNTVYKQINEVIDREVQCPYCGRTFRHDENLV